MSIAELWYISPWRTLLEEKPEMKIVCFDLWGTLIRSTYTGPTYEDYIAIRRPRAEIQATVRQVLMTRGLHRNQLVGHSVWDREISLWQYNELVVELIHQLKLKNARLDINLLAKLWEAENKAVEWIPNATEVLTQLRRQPEIKLILVTNTSGYGWEDVDKQLGITQYFDSLFISAEELAAKPDPYVWQTVRRWYPQADECWMIGDDPLLDIAMPTALGWKTILVGANSVPIANVRHIINGGEKIK